MALLVFPQQNILQYMRPLLVVNDVSELSVDEKGIAANLDRLFAVIR